MLEKKNFLVYKKKEIGKQISRIPGSKTKSKFTTVSDSYAKILDQIQKGYNTAQK